MPFKTNCRRYAIAIAVSAFLVSPLFAQRAGTPSSSSTAGAGSIGGNSTTSTGLGSTGRTNSPTQTWPGSSSQTGQQPSIFLSGTVIFDDGSKPNTDVVIERVCNGNPRPETHTDSKGRFSFQLGQSVLGFADASVSSNDSSGNSRTSGSGYPTGSTGNSTLGSNNRGASSLFGCELRASFPGYRSDVVDLSMRKSLDDPNVGSIILHRLANVQGSTISVTTALAPKKATKEYEKGLQLVQKSRFDEAEKHFRAALDEYPKYAVALFQLGNVQQAQGNVGAAQTSFKSAIEADGKYVSPYDRLARLAVQNGKWEEAETWSKEEVHLNPVEFPTGFLYNAIAEYELKNLDAAEKSAKELVKLDPAHHFAQAEDLLAQIYFEKRQYSDAATHLRTYLALAPNAKDADALKQQLLKIEQASAAPPPK